MVNITLQWPFSVILIRTSQIGTYIMKYPLFRLEFGSTQNWNWRKRLFCLFWDALLVFSENRVMQPSAKGWHEAVPGASTSPGVASSAVQPAAHPEHGWEKRGPPHLLVVSLLDALVQFLLSCSFYFFPGVSICWELDWGNRPAGRMITAIFRLLYHYLVGGFKHLDYFP